MDLNGLTVFAAVVEAGSFTAAAERLGVAKAKVSVQLARLEQALGTALLVRTTRRITLTDAGRTLHAQCGPLLEGLREAVAEAGAAQDSLSGTLRMSTTVLHAAQSLGPAVARFAALHPALRIDLRTGDKISDLVAEGIDLSFRMGWLRDSTQRAIKLGEFGQFVIASPEYVQRRGLPQRPEDLAEHDWIALSLLPTPLTWRFSSGGETVSVQMKSRLQVDAPSSLLALAQHGAGVSALDGFTAQAAIDAGRLVRLLPTWTLPAGGIYAVLPPGRSMPARVRAFIDFYRAELA